LREVRDRHHNGQEILRCLRQSAFQSLSEVRCGKRALLSILRGLWHPLAGNAGPAATGTPKAASTVPEIRLTPEQPNASATIDGERKTVTALFADIKGSTELEQDLLIPAYHSDR
jgi:hypothetical protein